MTKDQVLLASPRLRLNLETVVVAFATASLALVLAAHPPGGPLSSDVLNYANDGLNRIASTFVLNRYFHILFQGLFLVLAPTPLSGLQYYWAFLVSMTCLLVYVNARILSPQTTIAHGLLASAMFLSYNALGDYAGITYVDFTAMFMVMLIMTIHLLSARAMHSAPWLVVALGVAFFFAIKTKETTLPLAVLLPGLGFSDDSFSPRLLWRNLRYFGAGLLVGIALLAMWTWAVIGDPLFGLRPSEIMGFLHTYVRGIVGAGAAAGERSWVAHTFDAPLLVQSLLYIISGMRVAGSMSPARRVVWLIPLAFILFLTFTIDNSLGFEPRFYLHAVPVLCMLAPQFIEFAPLRDSREPAKLLAVAALTTLSLALVGGLLILRLQPDSTLGRFLSVFFYPSALCLLLAITFMQKTPSNRLAVIATVLVLALVGPPLLRNAKVMLLERPNERLTQSILYPFSAFRDEIEYTPTMEFYISGETWDAVGASTLRARMTEDQNATSSLFNLYFLTNASRGNFIDSAAPTLSWQDIIDMNVDYIVITISNWQSLEPAGQTAIELRYQPLFDEGNLLVLLRAR